MSTDSLATLDLWMILPLFLIGSLLHFTYAWSGKNKAVAVFSAVNESYWEHIKIAFWPIFFFALIEFCLGGREHLSFIPAKTISLYTVPISMVALVFAYKAFTKKNILFLDIAAFFVSVVLAQIIGLLLVSQLDANLFTAIVSLPFLAALVASFSLFTLHPPADSDFFKDPITGKYGIN